MLGQKEKGLPLCGSLLACISWRAAWGFVKTIGRTALATQNAVLTQYSVLCLRRKRFIFRTLQSEETVKPYRILSCTPPPATSHFPHCPGQSTPSLYKKKNLRQRLSDIWSKADNARKIADLVLKSNTSFIVIFIMLLLLLPTPCGFQMTLHLSLNIVCGVQKTI